MSRSVNTQRARESKERVKARRRRRRIQRLRRLLVFCVGICTAFFVGKIIGQEIPMEGNAQEAMATDQVELVLQKPDLPNGCEAVSMVMAMKSYGVEVNAVDFAINYLPRQEFRYQQEKRYGPNPEEYYVGDPSSTRGGWYCFEEPLIKGADRYLKQAHSKLRAKKITGTDLQGLKKQLKQGRPVVVWITSDYCEPRFHSDFTWTLPGGRNYTPYDNLHCVLLTGVENGNCSLADPLQGEVTLPEAEFLKLYEGMGKRAIILE